MTSPRPRTHSGCYLDVSQLVLSDPRFGPYSYSYEQHPANQEMIVTPDMNPIQGDTSHYQLSPFMNGFAGKMHNNDLNDLNDFDLDEVQPCPHRRYKQKKRKLTFTENDLLQDIIEIDQSDEYNSQDYQQCGPLCKTCSKRQINPIKSTQDINNNDQQNNQQYQNSSYNKTYTFMKESMEPQISIDFQNIKKRLKQFGIEDRDNCQQVLKQLLFDHQIPYYLDSIQSIDHLIKLLDRDITSQNSSLFKIPFGSRRCRVQKFIQKKKRRTWTKKVSYSCRKAVADGRLRIKGKFVTKQQVCVMLQLPSVDHLTMDQIKQLLAKNSKGNI